MTEILIKVCQINLKPLNCQKSAAIHLLLQFFVCGGWGVTGFYENIQFFLCQSHVEASYVNQGQISANKMKPGPSSQL
jgi:hypothetical protein